MSENVQSVAVKQESYSFKSLRPRRRIFTECLLSVIKRSQLYFYCPNLVKQFSGVKTEEQQGADGGGWGPFWALMLQAGSHNGGGLEVEGYGGGEWREGGEGGGGGGGGEGLEAWL